MCKEVFEENKMRYCCIDPECPNIERVEDRMNCPECGAKSQLVSYLYIQNLMDAKWKAKKLSERVLFSVGVDVDNLTDRLEQLLKELATHEAKRKKDEEIFDLVLLAKIQAVQTQMVITTQLGFIAAVKRLMGI